MKSTNLSIIIPTLLICFSAFNVKYARCFSLLTTQASSILKHQNKINTVNLENKEHLTGITKKHSALYMSMYEDEKSPSNAAIELVSKKLSSSLAKLDSLFQKSRKGSESEWIRLNVNEEDEEPEIVYMLPPPYTEKPSCVLIFLGGAVLGQFPHISYSELLQRLSVRMNAAILAIPYQVQLDHFNLAKQCATITQKALWKCEEEYEWNLQDDESETNGKKIPIFALSHSLGAKLLFIILAANTKWIMNDVQSIGFMSFNNFSFVQSISMLRTMVDQIRGGGKEFMNNDIMDKIFDMGQQITTGLSIEFYPNPEAMEELIKSKIDKEIIQKSRFFCFDDDNLDCTKSISPFFNSQVSKLDGNHLTPVYWKLSLDDLPVEEVRDIASQFTNGFRSASFGDEESLDGLVNEVYNWMIGKEPTRMESMPRITASSDGDN